MTQKERVQAYREGKAWHKHIIENGAFAAAVALASVADMVFIMFAEWIVPVHYWGALATRWFLWWLATAGVVIYAMRRNVARWWSLAVAGQWFFFAWYLARQLMANGYMVYYQSWYQQGVMPVTWLLFYTALWAMIGLYGATRIYLNRDNKKWLWRVMVGGLAWELVACYPLVNAATAFTAYLPDSFWHIFPAWSYIVVTPLAMLTVGGMVLFGSLHVSWQTFFAYLGAFIVVFSFLLNIDNQLIQYKVSKSRILGYGYRFWYWLRGVDLPEPPPDETHGARFADPREVAALRKSDGTGFGWSGGKPLFLDTEKHVIIMASTRSGKGVALIIPHLLRYRGSAFVLDPKGENCKATWRHRQRVNDKVRALDPFGITGKPRARFNPLSRFTPDTMDADSKALAAALITSTGREADPHFIGAAQQLGAGVILHVYTSPDIPPEHKDLVTVRSLLLGDIMGTLKKMAYSDAAGGMVAELAFSFLDTPERERGSIISVAQRQTEILDNPYIAACLAANGEGEEITFSDWHTGTMTVYLCLSAPKFPVFNRWLRLVLTSALDTMTDRLKPPSLPVCFLLDELATLGHLPAVENAVGLAAGYGIQLWSVFQDIAQMRELYRGRWASFIGNSGIRAIFNLDDYDTAHYWSQFMGGRLVETTSRQENIFGLSSGQGIGETMRPLRSAEELMVDYAKAKMLVLAQGEHPMETGRVPYFNDKTLQGLWDDPRYDVPPMPAPVIKKMAVQREPDAEPSNNGRDGRAYGLERE